MSKVNTTKCSLLFHCSEQELPVLVKASFERIADRLCQNVGMNKDDVMQITTRTGGSAIFAKLVAMHYLNGSSFRPDKDYLDALSACLCGARQYDETFHSAITPSDIPYLQGNRNQLLQGYSAALLDLHLAGALTLPFSYGWPKGHCGRKTLSYGLLVTDAELPPLLRLVRSVYDEEFKVYKVYTNYQKERVQSLGTKMILALGWRDLSDVNYDDLLKLKEAAEANGFTTCRPGFLISLLVHAYGNDCPITMEGWLQAQQGKITAKSIGKNKEAAKKLFEDGEGGDEVEPLLESLAWAPSRAYPDVAKLIFEDSKKFQFSKWIEYEISFLSYARYEADRQAKLALGYWNIYLFVYLTAWYAKNPDCRYDYPASPNMLLSSVFVSDIGLIVGDLRPLPFVKWLNHLADFKKWTSSSTYGALKKVEMFFAYLERFGPELPDCDKFKQPLSEYDYPYNPRPTGTNKRPIPRRIFSFYLRYIECLMQYFERVQSLILNGHIRVDVINDIFRGGPIDTFRFAGEIGFIPAIQYENEWYPLRFIPRVADPVVWPLRDGRTVKLLELHGLYHVYVALHTGIRHQHIQWLDARTFDQDNGGPSSEFARLYVNTDKVKLTGWTAHVSSSVIETLRKQLAWRKLIAVDGFDALVFYEGNPETKWPKILPLFSASRDGGPPGDHRYTAAWTNILTGVNAFLLDRGERSLSLGRLMPVSVPFKVPDELLFDECRKAAEGKDFVEITFKSTITPHSSRSSVVSHLATFLPADLIGRYITGQSTATVHYYTVPEQDELLLESALQERSLRTEFYNQDAYQEHIATKPTGASPYIKADDVNSALAKGMRKDVDAAIVSFGCMSLSVHELAENGLDVLKRTRFQGAAENKTEICPYGNICPPEIVKAIKGIKRCAICPYAVRSVDHLPAITAKGRQVMEKLEELEDLLKDRELRSRYTAEEIDRLVAERSDLAEEAAAWRLSEEVLEHAREKLRGIDNHGTWVVGRPDIVARDLRAVAFPTRETEYIVARLAECIEFPTLDSPVIKSKFDLLRRQILANTGSVREALSSRVPTNPAQECAGLIRSVMAINGLTLDEVISIATSDASASVPQKVRLLLDEKVLA